MKFESTYSIENNYIIGYTVHYRERETLYDKQLVNINQICYIDSDGRNPEFTTVTTPALKIITLYAPFEKITDLLIGTETFIHYVKE